MGRQGRCRAIARRSAHAVTESKQSNGKNIGVHGSPTLVESLLHADLLDELRLEIYPVIAGSGAPLFRKGRAVKQLDLVRSKVTANGVAIPTYTPTAASPAVTPPHATW